MTHKAHPLPNLERLHEVFEYKDGVLFWKKMPNNRTFIRKVGDKAGHLKPDGYFTVHLDGHAYPFHRVIYKMFYGDFVGDIDHIDQNPSNNKVENLRTSTTSENQRNVSLRKDNTSGIKNVSYDKAGNRWKVRIHVNGKPKLIGHFKDLELAELVAFETREKFHGKFAYHGNRILGA